MSGSDRARRAAARIERVMITDLDLRRNTAAAPLLLQRIARWPAQWRSDIAAAYAEEVAGVPAPMMIVRYHSGRSRTIDDRGYAVAGIGIDLRHEAAGKSRSKLVRLVELYTYAGTHFASVIAGRVVPPDWER